MKLMRFKNLYFVISALLIIPGMIFLLLFGLKPSVDFTGGSAIEIFFSEEKGADFLGPFTAELQENYSFETVQEGSKQEYSLRGPELTNLEKDLILTEIESKYGQLDLLSFESLGPTIGAELLRKALCAVALVAVIITLYIWRQFNELKYGLSAVLAMFHDSLVLLGSFSILGYFYQIEVDVLFITAMLTTLSFSVHDTIVVYDRIRELKKKNPKLNLEDVANLAVTETLSRSINNSITIIIVLLSLFLMGGESIRYFALALLIGSITGTYSSTFTAVPLLLIAERNQSE